MIFSATKENVQRFYKAIWSVKDDDLVRFLESKSHALPILRLRSTNATCSLAYATPQPTLIGSDLSIGLQSILAVFWNLASENG